MPSSAIHARAVLRLEAGGDLWGGHRVNDEEAKWHSWILHVNFMYQPPIGTNAAHLVERLYIEPWRFQNRGRPLRPAFALPFCAGALQWRAGALSQINIKFVKNLSPLGYGRVRPFAARAGALVVTGGCDRLLRVRARWSLHRPLLYIDAPLLPLHAHLASGSARGLRASRSSAQQHPQSPAKRRGGGGVRSRQS